MNSYKVTYLLNGEEHYDHITERTEKAAQKRVKGIYKDAEITDTELTSTDVNATKEQERETMEKIKAMVAELGPQSYLKTAFEGVFEIAEMNIDEDAAYSFPGRVSLLEEQLKEMGSKYNAARSDVEVLNSQLDHVREQLAAAQEQIATLKRGHLPEELRRDLWVMTTTEAEASRARMAEAAEKMAVGADNPGCVLFKDAVTLYRAEKARAEAMEQRAAELDALEGEEGGAA